MTDQNLDNADQQQLRNLLKDLSKKDIESLFQLTGVAATYEIVTNGIPNVYEGTHQFVRDIEVAKLMQDKFPNMPYDSAEGFRNWLQERLQGSASSQANALSRIQGDAGEVDFVMDMQGRLRNLFYKTDFVRDANGHVANNVPGIDVQEINRFTGNVVNEFQVKSLRSMESIDQTLKGFVNNTDYSPSTTLVGPKELIDEAKARGLPNPTRVMGTVESNAESADALKDKIQSSNMAPSLTPQAVLGKVASGACIGAAVSIGISAIMHFSAYRKGKITFQQFMSRLGKDGAKGAITGGALAGLSLFIPGGLIGMGVGFVVGATLRRALDDAFGEGIYAEVLDLTRSVQANVKLLQDGSVYMAELVEADGKQISRAVQVVNDMRDNRFQAISTLQDLERRYNYDGIVSNQDSIVSRLNRLDSIRKRMVETGND